MAKSEMVNEMPNQNEIKPEPMYDAVQAPSFANILNDSHAGESLASSDLNNVLNNSVPKNPQTIMLQPLVDSNENTIPMMGEPSIMQMPQPTQAKPTPPANGSINGLVQTMNEKLVVRTNTKAQQTPAPAWKKSTQSVAVSVVPSNNYPHNEVNATKQNNLGSNNSCSINNNIPIVPKVEDQQPSSKLNQADKPVHSTQDVTTTQQSSEVQTVPVSDMQSEDPFNNNAR